MTNSAENGAKATLDRAWSAYLRGDYDLCLRIIADIESEPARFLHARVLLRVGDPADAVTLLRFEAQDEAQRRRLMGTALARCGMFKVAEEEIRMARELAQSAEERAECDFYLALQEWTLGNLDEAEFLIPRHGVNARLAVLIEDLRGWIDSGRSDFKAALAHFVSALDMERARGESADHYVLARLAYSALAIARELSHVSIAGEIEAAIEGIAWTSATQVSRFHILRHLGWTVAIEGNFSATFRYLRQARDLAPSPAWLVSILCDMAYLALSVGERQWSDSLTEEARDLALSVQWADTLHEERHGLLFLAQILAHRDFSAAAQLLERYDALPDAPLMIARDDRDVALEAFVRGSVAHGSGDAVLASAEYGTAFEIYDQIGFQWRAIVAAVCRGEVTRRREYFEYAALQLRTFPNSWLRARVADVLAVYENPVSIRFTPSQLEVLRGLCEGKTDREIGAQTGRSASTVRDHLKEIRKITGTKKRSEIVAYCARHGLIENLRR